MKVELELWHLILLLLSFLGAVWAFAQVFFAQVDRRLDARFDSMERARAESSNTWTQRFDELRKSSAQEIEHWHRVERDLMALKVEMPREYIRREDHIRFETTIIAKLDVLNTRLDLQSEREGRKS